MKTSKLQTITKDAKSSLVCNTFPKRKSVMQENSVCTSLLSQSAPAEDRDRLFFSRVATSTKLNCRVMISLMWHCIPVIKWITFSTCWELSWRFHAFSALYACSISTEGNCSWVIHSQTKEEKFLLISDRSDAKCIYGQLNNFWSLQEIYPLCSLINIWKQITKDSTQ